MRSNDVKYLGYGLGIGALFAGLFFAAMFFVTPQFKAADSELPTGVQDTPSQIAAPSSTPAPIFTASTMTVTLTPTATAASTPVPPSSPTATLTESERMVASGEIAIAGPLTEQEQIGLYEASLFFIAPTFSESRKMSGLVNQLRFSDPSTTCGPLSIAILQKAGILNEFLTPHDFFLINPDLDKDRAILKTAFPAEYFSDTRYKVRIDQADWQANPLLPGDFVYIYSGKGGNFEHMLVVTRVDSGGRAYSVTNYNTEERGFIIDEALLYDPSDPNAGLFPKWTEKQFAKLGSTGYAGYEVWRLKENQ